MKAPNSAAGQGQGGPKGKAKYQRLPTDPIKVVTCPRTSLTTPAAEAVVLDAKASRCPKLSRYKLSAGFFVLLVAVVLIGITCIQNRRQYGPTCLRHDKEEAHDDEDEGMAHFRSSHTRRHLPHCLIIGARKAGTRALLYFLNLHPQIQTARREIHFFDRSFEEGLEWYRKQMPFSYKDQITMEKTPAYFVEPDVPERVYQMNSSIKLLLLVRDPIDRTMSDYLQIMDNKLNRGKGQTPFEQLVLDPDTFEINRSYSAVKRSIYVRHLQRWLKFFTLSQIHIIDGDNLVSKPWEEVQKVEEFLGIDHQISRENFVYSREKGFYCYRPTGEAAKSIRNLNDAERCLSEGKGRPHPDIDSMVLKKMIDFFTPFNQKFFQRIGRTFDWQHWRSKS